MTNPLVTTINLTTTPQQIFSGCGKVQLFATTGSFRLGDSCAGQLRERAAEPARALAIRGRCGPVGCLQFNSHHTSYSLVLATKRRLKPRAGLARPACLSRQQAELAKRVVPAALLVVPAFLSPPAAAPGTTVQPRPARVGRLILERAAAFLAHLRDHWGPRMQRPMHVFGGSFRSWVPRMIRRPPHTEQWQLQAAPFFLSCPMWPARAATVTTP